MKFNINFCVISECYIDTNLLETVVPPERIGKYYGYNHKHSCNKIVDEMMGKLKDNFAVGIVDQDRRPLSRTSEFELLACNQDLKLYKHKERNHYLIFHPPIEQWLLDEADIVGISLASYSLPITLKGLINETKNEFSKKDERFKRLFRDLIRQNALGITMLANWTKYLKEHPFNADKLELINL